MKKKSKLRVGDIVIVPEPKKNDYWKHSFWARIHCFKPYGDLVCVVDQEDNGWDVERNRLRKA